jgi:ssDNA-binding Zn-finger/Zn-ribbon topoisomerase 1
MIERDGRILPMAQTLSWANTIRPVISCPECEIEMRLLGTEAENSRRLVFCFECPNCGHCTRSYHTLGGRSAPTCIR